MVGKVFNSQLVPRFIREELKERKMPQDSWGTKRDSKACMSVEGQSDGPALLPPQREESLKLEKMRVAVEHERTTGCDGRRKRGDVGVLPWWFSS